MRSALIFASLWIPAWALFYATFILPDLWAWTDKGPPDPDVAPGDLARFAAFLFSGAIATTLSWLLAYRPRAELTFHATFVAGLFCYLFAAFTIARVSLATTVGEEDYQLFAHWMIYILLCWLAGILGSALIGVATLLDVLNWTRPQPGRRPDA